MATAKNLWHECDLHKQGHPSIYNLNDRKVTEENREMKIRKCEIGSPGGEYRTEKVIMFVGETGTGKTSTINTVVNYLLGVQWDDDERYQLVLDEDERKETTQTVSQTKWISSYTFHQTKRTDNLVTLVDTPGYGHTKGKEFDEFITSQVREFFSTKGEGGIDHIDAVAFVVKASDSRYSETQEYIFNSVFNLFGKDIADNLFIFITHVEAKVLLEGEGERHIPVMETIKMLKISPKGYCFCNNDVLFYENLKKDNLICKMNKGVWERNEDNLGTFLAKLDNCRPKSIFLSADVLKEREELEIIVKGIHGLIIRHLVEVTKLMNEAQVWDKYIKEINANENFRYESVKENIEEIILNEGERATVCNTCQITCHYPCRMDVFMKLGGVKMCAAMKSSKCLVCNCASEVHESGSKRYELNIVTVTKTDPFMKERYITAKYYAEKQENVVTEMNKKQIQSQQATDDSVEKLQTCLQRLGEISLRPNPYLILHHLEVLQHKETSEQKPQWQDRLTELRRIHEKFKNVIESNQSHARDESKKADSV